MAAVYAIGGADRHGSDNRADRAGQIVPLITPVCGLIERPGGRFCALNADRRAEVVVEPDRHIGICEELADLAAGIRRAIPEQRST